VIRNWRTKGVVQKILSSVPAGGWVNDQLQLRFGDLRHFERNIKAKVEDWACMMSYLHSVGCESVNGYTALEIGTGWYPTLPICFSLAGMGRIHCVDLTPHMSEALSFRMLQALEGHLGLIAEKGNCSKDAVERKYRRLLETRCLGDLLEAANVSYHAPADASRLDWMPEQSIDLVYSNSVLEHVAAASIPGLMSESRRVLKYGGLAAHEVGCGDHYAFFDKSISFVNYLQYTDRQWNLWNNDLNYQNRLRAPDFIRFAEGAGLEVVHQARCSRPGTMDALSRMQVARRFGSYDKEDLAATTVDFVARKKAPSPGDHLAD
jgi:hypothetical protein